MSKTDYEETAKKIAKAIDIGIAAIEKYPPHGFDANHVKQFVQTYRNYKSKALNPEAKFKNLKSLFSIQNDILIFFQESPGSAVNHFWNEVKNQNLPFQRVNKLSKILKRKRIKDQLEYDFVIDVIVPYQQEELISQEDIIKINEMIAEFENKTLRR